MADAEHIMRDKIRHIIMSRHKLGHRLVVFLPLDAKAMPNLTLPARMGMYESYCKSIYSAEGKKTDSSHLSVNV